MPTPRGISEASASKILVAALVSLIVTGGTAYLGLQFSHDYTASIGLLGTVNADAGRADPASASHELPAIAQAALTDEAVADLDRRVHPYSAMASKLFPKWTASRLRSQLSVENVYSGTAIGAIAIVFTGNNRHAALQVANAAAELLLQPHDPPPGRPTAGPPPQETKVKKSEQTAVPKVEAPAPPAVAAGVESAQIEMIRELRGRLAAIARNSLDLQTQISSESKSVTAIEQEKAHLREPAPVAQPSVKSTPPPPDPGRSILQSKLTAYEKVLAALRDRYTEDYPDVINARERVEELQAEMDQLPRPPSPTVEHREPPRPASDVPQRLFALDEREKPMEADLEEMRVKLRSNEAKAAGLRRLLMSMPAKSEPARVYHAPVDAVASVPETHKSQPAPIPLPRPRNAVPADSRFSVATPAEIRKTEQILSAESIAMVSVASGLGAGLAYLALGTRRANRKPRQEEEPEAVVV